MKVSLLRLGAVAALSIGALALPTTAFAGGGPGGGLCSPDASGQVTNCRFSGLFAEAGFSAGSFTGTETGLSLYVVRGRSLDAGSGPSADQSSIMLFASKVQADPNNPGGKPLQVAEIFGSLPSAPGFSIDNSLTSASLTSVSIPVSGFDQNGPLPQGSTVTVSAAWAGVGTINRSSFSFSYKSGGYDVNERFRSDLRYATASAAAVAGTSDWMSGLTQTFADLQSTSDASLTISHS